MKIFSTQLLRKKRFYISVAFAGLIALAYESLEFRLNDEALKQRLDSNPFGLKSNISYHQNRFRQVRYVEIGHDSLPLIVFCHGAPSSSAFWESLLKDSSLLEHAKLLAFDRPGYGYSGLGKPLISVKKQAKILSEIIAQKRKEHSSVILHGSSYGGTVAARIAMDYPDLIDGLLLQSASVAPGQEKTYWISYPTSHWSLKWLIPRSLRVANAEKLSHKNELEAMRPFWERIVSPTIIMHGLKDRLIYPKNAFYAQEQLVNVETLELQLFEENGHDLLWTQRGPLISSLLKLLHYGRERWSGCS